jgi:hypothetical protein
MLEQSGLLRPSRLLENGDERDSKEALREAKPH